MPMYQAPINRFYKARRYGRGKGSARTRGTSGWATWKDRGRLAYMYEKRQLAGDSVFQYYTTKNKPDAIGRMSRSMCTPIFNTTLTVQSGQQQQLINVPITPANIVQIENVYKYLRLRKATLVIRFRPDSCDTGTVSTEQFQVAMCKQIGPGIAPDYFPIGQGNAVVKIMRGNCADETSEMKISVMYPKIQGGTASGVKVQQLG